MFLVEFCYNNAQHSFMLISSFYVNYDYNSRCTFKIFKKLWNFFIEDLVKHLKETHKQLCQILASIQVKYKKNYDIHVKNFSNFKVEDFVWLFHRHIKFKRSSQKFNVKRLDSFKILEIIDENKLVFRLNSLLVLKYISSFMLFF